MNYRPCKFDWSATDFRTPYIIETVVTSSTKDEFLYRAREKVPSTEALDLGLRVCIRLLNNNLAQQWVTFL